MWSNNHRVLVVCVALVLVAGAAWGGPSLVEGFSLSQEIGSCERSFTSDAEKINCWLQIVFDRLRSEGLVSAYRAFSYLYETRPIFGASGCHQHAHKVGDTAYYELFVAGGLTLEEMNFPQETTSCGYGFFHGFVEHLIQDHPDGAYVTKTCEYLRERYSESMRDIGIICYHASGHGFTISKADTLTKSEWGNMYALVEEPLLSCESLPDISSREIEDCREGVFNVISDWMVLEDLGLSFDYEEPFKLCNTLLERWKHACYYELGMKLEPVIGDEPTEAEKFVRNIGDTDLRETVFGVMIAGMMQRQAPLNGYEEVLGGCLNVVDATLMHICVRSLVNGMMEHGSPGKEYEKILPLCAFPSLKEREVESVCYEALARRLSRFYVPEKKEFICARFPEAYADFCRETP